MSVKNCLIIARTRVLSITHFEKKKELNVISIKSNLVCLTFDLIAVDRNLVFLLVWMYLVNSWKSLLQILCKNLTVERLQCWYRLIK